jgi:hypothetical protein
MFGEATAAAAAAGLLGAGAVHAIYPLHHTETASTPSTSLVLAALSLACTLWGLHIRGPLLKVTSLLC